MLRIKKMGKKTETKTEIQEILDKSLKDDDSLPSDIAKDEDYSRIISSFPSSEGYYGKLYRIRAGGAREFLYHVTHLEDIDDPELTVMELAKENNWDGKEFLLRIFHSSKKGAIKSIPLYIAQSNNQSNIKENQPISFNNLSGVKEIINAVRDITDDKSSSQLMAEAFKSGVDTIKNSISKTENNNKNDNLFELLEILKSLGIVNNNNNNNNEKTSLIDTIKILKELNIIPEEKEPVSNPFEKMIEIKTQMETLGLLKTNTSSSSLSSMALVMQMLAPKIPEIINSITNPFTEFFRLQQAKIISQQPIQPIQQQPIQQQPNLDRPPFSPPIDNQSIAHLTEAGLFSEDQMLNIFKIKSLIGDIATFYKANNITEEAYIKITNGIIYVFGNEFIDNYINGTITKEMVLDILSSQDILFTTNEFKIYFDKYSKWLFESETEMKKELESEMEIEPDSSNGNTA